VKEDWSFVDTLTATYKARLQTISADDVETIQQGTGEAAFVYYSTEEELLKYFNAPYQEEYKQFRQIFFVKSDLESKPENPLNALRHNQSGNLTGQIDLDDRQYKLVFNEDAKGGVRISVNVNGKKCHPKGKIRKKNELEIIYTIPCFLLTCWKNKYLCY
jgi:hypothetical protein